VGGEIRNSRSSGVLITQLAHHNEFLQCKLQNNGGAWFGYDHGIYIAAPDNLVDGCQIAQDPGYAIHVYDGSAVPSAHRNIIRNNRISNSAWAARQFAILAGSGEGNQVYNNLVYDSYGCIAIAHGGARNTLVANNTCVNTPGYGIYSDGSNSEIKNNLLFKTAGLNNRGTGAVDGNLINVDPGFMNAGIKDFRLQSGSRAIHAGTTVPAVVFDIVGALRPPQAAYSVGAYEYTDQ
jgi:hypothetical protein